MDNKQKYLAEQPKKSVGAILNLPPPVELDTIGSGHHETLKSSKRGSRHHDIKIDARIDRGGSNAKHISPQMRLLSKKDG